MLKKKKVKVLIQILRSKEKSTDFKVKMHYFGQLHKIPILLMWHNEKKKRTYHYNFPLSMTSIVLCFFSEYCQTFEVDGIKQDMPQKVFLT